MKSKLDEWLSKLTDYTDNKVWIFDAMLVLGAIVVLMMILRV